MIRWDLMRVVLAVVSGPNLLERRWKPKAMPIEHAQDTYTLRFSPDEHGNCPPNLVLQQPTRRPLPKAVRMRVDGDPVFFLVRQVAFDRGGRLTEGDEVPALVDCETPNATEQEIKDGLDPAMIMEIE